MRTWSCTEVYLSELSPCLLFSLPFAIPWFLIYPSKPVPSSAVAAPSIEVTLTPAQSIGQRSEDTWDGKPMLSSWPESITDFSLSSTSHTPFSFSIPLASPRSILQSGHWGPLNTSKNCVASLRNLTTYPGFTLDISLVSQEVRAASSRSALYCFHYTSKVD